MEDPDDVMARLDEPRILKVRICQDCLAAEDYAEDYERLVRQGNGEVDSGEEESGEEAVSD